MEKDKLQYLELSGLELSSGVIVVFELCKIHVLSVAAAIDYWLVNQNRS